MKNKTEFYKFIMIFVIVIGYLILGLVYFGFTAFPETDTEILYQGILFLILSIGISNLKL